MNDQVKTEQPNEAHISQSALNDGLEVIRTSDNLSKARIWCSLNRSEWPEEFINIERPVFENMASEFKQRFIWELMSEAMDSIGIKECLREWNKETLPGESFDEWYGNRGIRTHL
jgi:hypothetical protein